MNKSKDREDTDKMETAYGYNPEKEEYLTVEDRLSFMDGRIKTLEDYNKGLEGIIKSGSRIILRVLSSEEQEVCFESLSELQKVLEKVSIGLSHDAKRVNGSFK